MSSKQINEAIQNNDLADLISAVVSIDQYKSKVGDDKEVVVVAFRIKDKDPAADLSQFLETGHSALDVDISPGPDVDGMYTVFLELERGVELYEKIDAILKDVQRVDNTIQNWQFNSYESDSVQPWSKEAFDQNVISNSYDYVIKHDENAKAISERIKFLNKY
jgi:hypothetical protein